MRATPCEILIALLFSFSALPCPGALPTVPALCKKLEHEAQFGAPNRAEEIARTLDRTAVKDDLPTLQLLLSHPSRKVRLFAAIALHSLDPEKSTQELINQLALPGADENGIDIWRSFAIGEIVARSEFRAAPALAELLAKSAERNESMAEEAVKGLQSLPARKVRPVIETCLRSPSPQVRLYATLALSKTEPALAIAEIQRLWAARASLPPRFDETVAYQGTLLARLELVPLYLDLLAKGSENQREEAALVLGKLQATGSAADVMRHFADPEPEVRAASCLAIDWMAEAGGQGFLDEAAQALAETRLSAAESGRVKEALDRLSSENGAEPKALKDRLVAQRGRKPAPPYLSAWLTVFGVEKPSAEGKALQEVASAKEACDHWGAEDPYDSARAKEIAAGAKRDCGALVRKTMVYLRRYPKSAELKHLAREVVESVGEAADTKALSRMAGQ